MTHRGDHSVSRSDCKPCRKIGESRLKSWMNVIPVRVGQASSRGQCLTSSVKLRDLGDRWGRNEGEINREDFDSSHFTARRWIEESIFKFSFFPLGNRILQVSYTKHRDSFKISRFYLFVKWKRNLDPIKFSVICNFLFFFHEVKFQFRKYLRD